MGTGRNRQEPAGSTNTERVDINEPPQTAPDRPRPPHSEEPIVIAVIRGNPRLPDGRTTAPDPEKKWLIPVRERAANGVFQLPRNTSLSELHL